MEWAKLLMAHRGGGAPLAVHLVMAHHPNRAPLVVFEKKIETNKICNKITNGAPVSGAPLVVQLVMAHRGSGAPLVVELVMAHGPTVCH